MSIDSMLNTTATLERPSPSISKDTSGGSVRTFAAVSGMTDVPCSAQAMSSRVKAVLAQRQVYISHNVYFGQDIGARNGDRLTLASGLRLTYEGYRDMAGRGEVWVFEGREQTT